MKRISQTVVLDEFDYIMIPAVEAFLKNIVQYQEKPHPADDEIRNRFIENWTLLIEYLMREEDQLTHYPDLRPTLFDFSVVMLEYTTAFLNHVVKILQFSDGADKSNDAGQETQRINMLLVPRLCSRIEAQELFAADKLHGLPGLVLVTIPVADLYKPNEIQRALCHEVSHFVGEKNRCREIRTVYYFRAASILITKLFYNTYDFNYALPVQKFLYNDFKSSKKRQTIQNMKDCVLSSLYDVIDAIPRRGTTSSCDHSSNTSLLEALRVNRSAKYFADLLEDVGILFREIYADICMLYILPEAETRKYIVNLFEELVNGEVNDKKRRYEQFAIRMYVSLKALEREDQLITVHSLMPSYVSYRLYEELYSLSQANTQESTSRLIPFGVVNCLQEYADKCVGQLRSNCDKQGYQALIGQARKMFLNIASKTINYEDVLKHISEYRQGVLQGITITSRTE